MYDVGSIKKKKKKEKEKKRGKKKKEEEKKRTFPRLQQGKEFGNVINSQLCHVCYTRCSRGKESQVAHAARALATAESSPSPKQSAHAHATFPPSSSSLLSTFATALSSALVKSM